MIDDNIRDLCRICVEGSEDYIRIYDEVVPDNTPFFYIINDVCQLDISEDDGFPEYVCKDCFLKISEFMLFKRKSHEAKLNFLSKTVSLAEASHSKDLTGLENEAVVATSIIVKEMSSEGVMLDVSQPVDIIEEASHSKDLTGLENEAIVATSIIVNEMTSEGVMLDVAQPGDIIEEVITMPYVVDYEEVVTADTYTLGEDQVYEEMEEEVPVVLSPVAPPVDRKRNSKEREVAIILADGGSTRVCQEKKKENEAKIVQDTGQEVKAKVTGEVKAKATHEVKVKVKHEVDEEEENLASRRRSFVAQAYYRSYLLEKERKAEEKIMKTEEKIMEAEEMVVETEEMIMEVEAKIMEEANEDHQDSVQEVEDDDQEAGEALGSGPGSPGEEEMVSLEEEASSGQDIPIIVEVAHVEEDSGVNGHEIQEVILTDPVLVESSVSEEVSPEAVCCKKKMLAISKSLELSRSLEQSEKVAKTETLVVGSDLDVLVEACGSRERSRASEGNKTRDASGVVPTVAKEKPLKSRVVKCANVPGGVGNRTGKRRRNSMKSQDTGQPEGQSDSSKTSLYAVTRADRRGVAPGPRFRLSGGVPTPPKKIKKAAPALPAVGAASQGLEYIQVIASEELRAKGQQLDLEQVGDILKTSLLCKKTFQVSEVGPSGKVFHVEPTIVKLKSMPMAGGRHHILRPHNGASAESAKSVSANIVRTKRVSEGESGEIFTADGANIKEEMGCGRSKVNNVELPLHSLTPPAAIGTYPIDLLGNGDGSHKTLLLTASKEENSDAPAMAILLRPLKQEEEDEMGDPLLEMGDELMLKVKEERGGVEWEAEDGVGGEDPQQEDEGTPSADPEAFCNRIRLRAKKAMLACMKKTLDDLERMGMSQKEGAADGEKVLPDPLAYELEVKVEEGRVSGEEEGEGEEEEERLAEEATMYTCVHCGQSSYSKVEMGWHMKEAHAGDKQSPQYYCTRCDRCFYKRYIYRLHMEMHDMMQEGEEGAVTAYEEGEEVSQGESAQPSKCSYCGLLFSGKSAVLFHEASKHQASPLYPCSMCSKKFLSDEKREAHQSLCSGNRLECEICHKEYNVGSILQHMRTHRGEKPYLCAECGKTFSQKGDLKRHTRQIHQGLEPVKPFLCSYCPKTFSAQSKLRIHERSHTKEKPYKCDECGKGFAHLATLRKHRENREFACLPVIEQSTKPYTCSICKKGWDQKYALTKHIAWVHERKRPSRTFPCQYCSKVYYCRSQLTYHERTHTKEKPYACGVCDKSFMYNSVRKAHMAKEHGMKRSINDGPR